MQYGPAGRSWEINFWIQRFYFLESLTWWKPEHSRTNDNNIITCLKNWKIKIITSARSDMKQSSIKFSWSFQKELSCFAITPPKPWHKTGEWAGDTSTRQLQAAALLHERASLCKLSGSEDPKQLELKGCRYGWIPSNAVNSPTFSFSPQAHSPKFCVEFEVPLFSWKRKCSDYFSYEREISYI